MGGCLIEPADSLVQPVIPDQSRARADLKQTKQSAPLSIQHWLENRRCGGVWSEPTEVSGGSETGGLICASSSQNGGISQPQPGK
jgi:hypothetical protein